MDEAISRLVATVEEVAPHVWVVMMRQAQIDAWVSLFWFMMCVGIIIIGVHALCKWARRGKQSGIDFIDWDALIPVILAALIGSIILLVVVPTTLYATVTGFINPEYVAIKTLLQLVS